MAKKKTSVRPLYDRVLLQRLDAADEVRGGIIIPDTAKEKPLEATVVAVGPGKRLEDGSHAAMTVSVGDTVLVGKYGGTEISLNGVDFLIVREDEVLGIIG
jgi:chaperonin GroES